MRTVFFANSVSGLFGLNLSVLGLSVLGLTVLGPVAGSAYADMLPVYTFDVVYRGKDLDATGSVDPSRPHGRRVQVHTPAKARWSDDFSKAVAELEEEPEKTLWCANWADIMPDGTRPVSTQGGIETLVFTPLPTPGDKDSARFSRHLRAEVRRDSGDRQILGVTLRAPKAFNLSFMGNISRFQVAVTCSRSPDGRTFAAMTETEIVGDVANNRFEEREIQIISNLKTVQTEKNTTY